MVDVAVIDKVRGVADRTGPTAIVTGSATSRHGAGAAIGRLKCAVGVMTGGTGVMDFVVGGAHWYAGGRACGAGMTGGTLAVRCHQQGVVTTVCGTDVTGGAATIYGIEGVMVDGPGWIGSAVMAIRAGIAHNIAYGSAIRPRFPGVVASPGVNMAEAAVVGMDIGDNVRIDAGVMTGRGPAARLGRWGPDKGGRGMAAMRNGAIGMTIKTTNA